MKEDIKAKNVFHEIKNQISVCELYAEVIKRALEKKGIEDESLMVAIQNIKTSLEIISASAKCLREEAFDQVLIKDIVNNTFEICKTYKAIKFTNAVNSKDTLIINKHKFISAMTNLVKNAIEAGATEVKITNNAKNIYVEDNGEAIPPENQEKIFSGSFTTKENGNGLGLMLTQQNLAEQGFGLKLEKSDENLTIFNIYRL